MSIKMSLYQIKYVSSILKDDFGETVEKVCVHLLQKGNVPSGIIAQQLGLILSQVKRALSVLIQHNIVAFEYNKKGFVEYRAILDNILARARYPIYMYVARTLYGDAAELIVEELIHHGQSQLSTVVYKLHERLKQTMQDSGVEPQSIYAIRDKYVQLIQTQFIQRCAVLDDPDKSAVGTPTAKSVPVFREQTEAELYVVPKIDLNEAEKKRKRSLDSSEQAVKKAKVDTSEDDIYWRVNYERFDRHIRDQTLIRAITSKIDTRAGEIFRTILRLSEVNSDVCAPATNALSYNEIFQALPNELGLSRQTVDQYMKIMVEDSIDFVHKVGDSGGGMYSVNFQKSFITLCKAHIQSVVQERFGSKSLRIYKLLMMKKQLEQKQIEESAMVPAKEAKELIYAMFGENFVTLTELPKTPDHAPSRTFFLFSVNVNQVARMLLERCYKALYNLILRRNQELSEHKRLLEKHQRTEAIIASLVQSGADQTQKEEIEEMITPAEKNLVSKVKSNTKKMEMAELQLEDTMFVLNMYLHYSHLK